MPSMVLNFPIAIERVLKLFYIIKILADLTSLLFESI